MKLVPLVLVVLAAGCGDQGAEPPPRDLAELGERLAALQERYAIPGMAAGIASQDHDVWTQGFGFARTADQTAAGPETVFHLASLTKTFAAAVVLGLAEEGLLGLEDRVNQYGVQLSNSADVRIWHLLSHTSEGVPGTQFRYNGDRFALLDQVIQQASGRSFAELSAERIIQPLGLARTGPSRMSMAAALGLDTVPLRQGLATGYSSDGRQPVAYPTSFGSAAGMLSDVLDMLAYSRAWDEDRLLLAQSRARAFRGVVTARGDTLPYGLGWFVTRWEGMMVVWHYGYWTANSSLIVKVPERGTTFVLLANNDMLSRPFDLGSGDLLSSPFARLFLEWLRGQS